MRVVRQSAIAPFLAVAGAVLVGSGLLGAQGAPLSGTTCATLQSLCTVSQFYIPVTISFPNEGDPYTFPSTAVNPSFSVSCQASATPPGLDPLIVWNWSAMGSPTTITASAFSGPSTSITYTNLPSLNTSFGPPKAFAAWVPASMPPCVAVRSIRIFYTRDAKNHPGTGSGTTPNWFYYWGQTSAHYGNPVYLETCDKGWTDWSGTAWVAYLGPNLSSNVQIYDGPLNPNNTNPAYYLFGIDGYGYTCRHEAKHVSKLHRR